MGTTNSKPTGKFTEENDVVKRCRERKRFIKLTMKRRDELADAHGAYMDSLRETATKLRNYAQETETINIDSSLGSELQAGLQGKSNSSSNNNSEHHLHMAESESPSPRSSISFRGSNSPSMYGGEGSSPVMRMHYMMAGATQPMTFEEKPPLSPLKVKVESFSTTPQDAEPQSPASSHKSVGNAPSPPPPQISTWDFFDVFNTVDNPFNFADPRGLSMRSEGYFTDSSHLREEDGIPDLDDGDHEDVISRTESTKINVPIGIKADMEEKIEHDIEELEEVPISRTDAYSATSKEVFVEETPAPKAVSITQESGNSRNMEEEGEEEVEQITKTMDESTVTKESVVIDKEAIVESTYCSEIPVNRDKSFLGSIKLVEELFIRSCHAGVDVSKILEVNKPRHYPSFAKKKVSWKSRISSCNCIFSCFNEPTSHALQEAPSKSLAVVTWQPAASSSSLPSRIPVASCSKDNIEDDSSDVERDTHAKARSHALTLATLYAWEKKLYLEVKEIDSLKSEYDKKCSQLRNLEANDQPSDVVDKTRLAIKDLHSRIKVAIKAVDSISKNIQRLRDDELQPQLIDFIEGLLKMWKIMFDCHQAQHLIMANISGQINSLASREGHRQLTSELERDLQNWHVTFGKWIDGQKGYVRSLYDWLLKCILVNSEASTRQRQPFSPRRSGAPSLVVICHLWVKAFEKMPREVVVEAMKTLLLRLKPLSMQLDANLNSEKKAGDSLYDKKMGSIPNVGTSVADRKELLESFRNRTEEENQERSAHIQNSYVMVLKTGLENGFQSMEHFANIYIESLQEILVEGEKTQFDFLNGRSYG